MSILKILQRQGENLIKQETLSVNDFGRQVLLVTTDKNKYIVKTGRETKREAEILLFLKNQAGFDFAPQVIWWQDGYLFLPYYEKQSFKSLLNKSNSEDLNLYLGQLAVIFNYFLNPELFVSFAKAIKNKQKGFYNLATKKYLALIAKEFLTPATIDYQTQFTDFWQMFRGITDLDFGWDDFYVADKKIYLFDFEYFVADNLLIMLSQTLLGLLADLPESNRYLLVNFIDQLQLNVPIKDLLKQLFTTKQSLILKRQQAVEEFLADWSANKSLYLASPSECNQQPTTAFTDYLLLLIISLIKKKDLLPILNNGLGQEYLKVFLVGNFRPISEKITSGVFKREIILSAKLSKLKLAMIKELQQSINDYAHSSNYELILTDWQKEKLLFVFKLKDSSQIITIFLSPKGKYYLSSKNWVLAYLGQEAKNDMVFIDKIANYLISLDKEYNYNIF